MIFDMSLYRRKQPLLLFLLLAISNSNPCVQGLWFLAGKSILYFCKAIMIVDNTKQFSYLLKKFNYTLLSDKDTPQLIKKWVCTKYCLHPYWGQNGQKRKAKTNDYNIQSCTYHKYFTNITMPKILYQNYCKQ